MDKPIAALIADLKQRGLLDETLVVWCDICRRTIEAPEQLAAANDRLQVFTKAGTFLREVVINRDTLGSGSVWDVGFSTHPAQT